MTLQTLLSRVEPPSSVVPDRDWAAATESLGIVFVQEYRDVVGTFGRGYLEPGVVIWDPRSDRFEGDVSGELEAMADPELGSLHASLPYPPFPGSGRRLLPVAADGSGAYVMVVIADGVQVESEYWWCDLDGGVSREFRCGFASVLLQLADDPSSDYWSWRFASTFHPL